MAVNEVGACDDHLQPVTDTFPLPWTSAQTVIQLIWVYNDDWKLTPYYSIGYLEIIYYRTKNDANQL